MKLVFFNLREDEKSALESWRNAHPEVEIDVYTEELISANKHLLEGKEGVVLAQNKPFERDVYEYAKEQGVKVFATRSAGFDIYDLELMSEFGIKMTNVPSYSPNAIAEHVLTSALRISRNTNKIQRNLERHNFSWNPGILSRELRTLTVGVLSSRDNIPGFQEKLCFSKLR